MSFRLKNLRFTKSSAKQQVFKNEGVSEKENNDIIAYNCGESSFQESLSWERWAKDCRA